MFTLVHLFNADINDVIPLDTGLESPFNSFLNNIAEEIQWLGRKVWYANHF